MDDERLLIAIAILGAIVLVPLSGAIALFLMNYIFELNIEITIWKAIAMGLLIAFFRSGSFLKINLERW